MIAARIDALELIDAWQEGDPTMRERFAFPIDALAGAASTAAVYFEVRPGHHCGRHVHTAEELLLILAGETEARVGEETARLPTGGLVVAPAGVPHDLYCVGQGLCVLGRGAAEQGHRRVGVLAIVAQPRGDVAAAGEVEQAEGGIAEQRQDHRPGPEAGLAAVLAEHHVLAIVQTVFDPPVPTLEGEEACRIGVDGREAGDAVVPRPLGQAAFAPGALQAEDLR